MLRSTEGEEQSRSVVIAFAAHVAGTGLVIWGSLVSLAAGNPINFSIIPNGAGIYLLLAAGLRLGCFSTSSTLSEGKYLPPWVRDFPAADLSSSQLILVSPDPSKCYKYFIFAIFNHFGALAVFMLAGCGCVRLTK